jgi:hypothetical protein
VEFGTQTREQETESATGAEADINLAEDEQAVVDAIRQYVTEQDPRPSKNSTVEYSRSASRKPAGFWTNSSKTVSLPVMRRLVTGIRRRCTQYSLERSTDALESVTRFRQR